MKISYFEFKVVIASEWYITSRPLGVRMSDGNYPECNVSENRFFLLHIYPATLLLLAFFYGISVLKIKRNFNEGRWITCATLFVIPVFVAWSVTYHFAPIHFHDPSTAVSIVAVAGILLSAIFMPKMHTIAQQTKYKNALKSGISSIDLQRSHSDSTVFTGFSEFSPQDGGRHFQTNASTMHKLYQQHQPPQSMVPPETSLNGTYFNNAGRFVIPSVSPQMLQQPHSSYNSSSTRPALYPMPSGLPANAYKGTSSHVPSHSPTKHVSRKSEKGINEQRSRSKGPTMFEFNGLNYMANPPKNSNMARVIHHHQHNPQGQGTAPTKQSYADWSKELFPDYGLETENATDGSKNGTLPNHHYYNHSAAFYNQYNLHTPTHPRGQQMSPPQQLFYPPAHYGPISNPPNMFSYGGAEDIPQHLYKKERKSRKDEARKKKIAASSKKRHMSSSPDKSFLLNSNRLNSYKYGGHNNGNDLAKVFVTSASKSKRWRSHSSSSREEPTQNMIPSGGSNPNHQVGKSHTTHTTFSAAVPMFNSLMADQSRSPTKEQNRSFDIINHQKRERAFKRGDGDTRDDHDLITTMIGGGNYHNYNRHNLDDILISKSSRTTGDVGKSTRERYNKILSTAMPATEYLDKSKDDSNAQRKGSSNSKSSNNNNNNNHYLDIRSSSTPRTQSLQRHSHSPSDGMILTASGLTLEPNTLRDLENEVYILDILKLIEG